MLIDNAPYSYMLQPNNGIPILNYLKGRDDDQLIKLEPYLMGLLDVEDVRTVNHETFRMQDFHRYEHYERLVGDLYGRWM